MGRRRTIARVAERVMMRARVRVMTWRRREMIQRARQMGMLVEN